MRAGRGRMKKITYDAEDFLRNSNKNKDVEKTKFGFLTNEDAKELCELLDDDGEHMSSTKEQIKKFWSDKDAWIHVLMCVLCALVGLAVGLGL